MINILLALELSAVVSIVYIVALIFYRLYFSPASHIPGPRLAAVTYYYQFYYDVYPYQGQFMFHCGKLHEKYGPIIRIGPDEVHVNDISFYSEIYTNNSRKRCKPKLWFWSAGLDSFAGKSTFMTLDHDLHRLRRSAFGQYFSRSRVLELQPRILHKTELLKKALLKRAETGELVDLRDACGALTLEVITEYAFGQSIPVLGGPDFAMFFNNLARTGVKIHPIGRAFPTLVRTFITLPEWMMAGNKQWEKSQEFPRQIRKAARSAFDEAMELDEKDGKTEKRVTVLREMVRSEVLPPEEKEFKRIMNDAAIFVGAGMETTGHTLAVTLYHVLANPEIHRRLEEELRTAVPTSESDIPSVSTLETLPFLTAVITEGLRITHASPGRLARIAPDEDLVYRGFKIPRGTVMSQSNYFIHTNPAVYSNPHEFHPERFLGPNASEAQKSLIPFSRGTRMCVGMNLAWAEMYLTIAQLLTSVRMELVDTTIWDASVEAEYFIGCMPRDSKGIRVRVLGTL